MKVQSISIRFVFVALLMIAIVALRPAVANADEQTNGPTSLVITYKAQPQSRAAFRAYMEKYGAAQFAQWQKAGIFIKSNLLFSSYAGGNAFDLVVILDFAHYTDLARWIEIEKTLPGGLPSEALALGAPDSSSLAEMLTHGEAERRDPAKAAYMIAFYEVVTDGPRYRRYVEGYTVPQMKGWIDAGVLTCYTMYLNQNPAGALWDSMLVLEYKDMAGLAQRESVKAGVRQRLGATDPVWKRWSEDKGAIRKEKSLAIADAIVPATSGSR